MGLSDHDFTPRQVRSNFSLTELQTSLAACDAEKLRIQQTIDDATSLRRLDETSLRGCSFDESHVSLVVSVVGDYEVT